MDYYPSDTGDRPIAPQQQNTPAPIALYQGGYRWVNPKVIFGVVAGASLLIIGAIAMRSTAINADTPIKIEALSEPQISKESVDNFILEGSTDDLKKLRFATTLRITSDQLALKHQRAKQIKDYALKHLVDKNSPCYRSPSKHKCYISIFATEQIERYREAYSLQKWQLALATLGEIEAAHIAWTGINDLPVEGDATALAIENELKAMVNNQKVSANVMAAEMRAKP